MSNTNTEVLTTAYEKLQGALTQSNTVLPKLEEAVKNADLSNYAKASDLEENTNRIDDLSINIFSYTNTSDADKLLNALNDAIKNDFKINKYLKSSKVLIIDKPIVLDFMKNNASKGSIQVDLIIQPVAGIGTALTIKNANGVQFNIKVIGGGQDGDVGVEINSNVQCTFNIYGRNYKGLLFKVTGNREDNTHNTAIVVNRLHGINCGQLLQHGVDNVYSSGFGSYVDIYDQGSTYGSIFKKCYDVTVLHYENYFNDTTLEKYSLTFDDAHTMFFGHVALGNLGKGLLLSQNSDCYISKLHLFGNNITGLELKGTKNDIHVNSLYSTSCKTTINDDGKGKIRIDNIKPHNNEQCIVSKNNINIGLPINENGSYYNNNIDTIFNTTETFNVYRDKLDLLNKQEYTAGDVTQKVWKYTANCHIDVNNEVFSELDNSIQIYSTDNLETKVIIDIPFVEGNKSILKTNFRIGGITDDCYVSIEQEFRDSDNQFLENAINMSIENSSKEFYIEPSIYTSNNMSPSNTSFIRTILKVKGCSLYLGYFQISRLI